MSQYLILIPILLPLIGGAVLPLFHFENRRLRQLYIMIIVLINSGVTFWLISNPPAEAVNALKLAGTLDVKFHLDGLGSVFAGLIAGLWPFASLYAFEYMKHEGAENRFFSFYTMTYGVTLGIAFAENLVTLYMFYEMLTLVTIPLVMHSMNKKSIRAARKYAFYSIGGAAFAFIGFIFILIYGNTLNFTYGGVLNLAKIGDKAELLRVVYVLAVLGFGVKAAIFPFHGWLPTASVAPTPVTALLHAVAVVKAGAFAIIRITYYSFGTDFLYGTWAQNVILIFAMVTIVYGSARAVKEQHLKRRLAYSTVSNLSYVVFGAALMTPAGLVGALTHMICHAVMKITLFYCAGAILYKTEREYINEMSGLGRKMPVVFGCYTIASAALVGIPPLAGFLSKWELAVAASDTLRPIGAVGIVALMISALLTAIYLFTVVVRAYFPSSNTDLSGIAKAKDPNWLMKFPLIVLTVAIVVLGVWGNPLIHYFSTIANGLR